jgi:hypothetical protein
MSKVSKYSRQWKKPDAAGCGDQHLEKLGFSVMSPAGAKRPWRVVP